MSYFKGKKLLLFGDSIMFGSGNGGIGVGEYLAEKFGFELNKYCVGGARVGWVSGKSWVVKQVQDAINDKARADYILFDGFTNDCCTNEHGICNVPLGEMSEGYDGFDIFAVKSENSSFSNCFENIVAAFKMYYPAAKLLFVRPHKMGRRDAKLQVEYGERAIEICNKWDVHVSDIYTESPLNTFLPEHRDKYTADTYGLGMGDCTHPNAAGYLEMYMPVLEKALKNLH